MEMKKRFFQLCSCIFWTLWIFHGALFIDNVIAASSTLDSIFVEHAYIEPKHKVDATPLVSPTLKLIFISSMKFSYQPTALTQFVNVKCRDLTLEFPTEARKILLAKSIELDYFRNTIQLALYENFLPDYHYLGDLDGLQMKLKVSCGGNYFSGTITLTVEERHWYQKLYTNDNPPVYNAVEIVHKTHPFIELRDSEETFGKKTERKRKITQPSEVVLPPITETATEEKQSRSLTMQPTHEVAQGSVVTLDPPPQAALQQGTTPVNVPELLPAAGSSTHTGNENQMDPKQPATYPSSSNIQVVAPPAVTSTHATPVNNLQRPVISVPSNDQNLVPPYEATEIVQPGYDLRSNTSPDQSSTLEAAPFLPSLSSTPQYNAPSHSPGTPLLTTTYG
ncbi:hypothetical protein HMI56_001659 [Coelomomyces lativittatus]|nr:hypothetical protein HMI56_001659 [Coelomomyces lativittatus]